MCKDHSKQIGHLAEPQGRQYLDCNHRILAIVDDFPNRETLLYLRSLRITLDFN